MNASESQPTSGDKPASNRRTVRFFARFFGILLFPFVVLLVLLSVGINIDLSSHRADINSWLTKKLDRPVSVNGNLKFYASWSPEVQLGGIEIKDSDPNAYMPFFTAGVIDAKIDVWPLLQKTLILKHIGLKDIQLNAQVDAEGKPNWLFPGMAKNEGAVAEHSDSPSESNEIRVKLSDSISASQVTFNYFDQTTYQSFDWSLESLELTKADSWQMKATGAVIGEHYDLTLEGELESLINTQTGKVAIEGEFAGAALNVDADIKPLKAGTSTATLDFNWFDTSALEYHMGLDAKYATPLSIRANLKASASGFSMSDLKIDSPVTQGDGSLDVALAQSADEKNTISGALSISFVDFRPWLQPEEVPEMIGYASGAPQKSPLQLALEQWLEKTETDIKLGISEIKGLGINVSNLTLNIEGKEGKLTAPITADIAKVPFRGHANIDASEWMSTVDVRLGAKDSQLGEMAGWITGIPNAEALFKKLSSPSPHKAPS
ncbi:AsmA family protein [Veronia nyctiphanis]|uniref:AsmA family protein n=1 Tax=Veronia nyctiphanis TaxID=1278244 RepID=UPI001F419198|nr:AsmA family protein [Veronia nyctiphanis]